MGNHEDALLHDFGPLGPYPSWLKWDGRSTTDQYKLQPKLLAGHLPWLESRPLLWQNGHVLVSHAGLADIPLGRGHGPRQLRRHSVAARALAAAPAAASSGPHADKRPRPGIDRESNASYIDTGAVFGGNLAGVRLSPTGEGARHHSDSRRPPRLTE